MMYKRLVLLLLAICLCVCLISCASTSGVGETTPSGSDETTSMPEGTTLFSEPVPTVQETTVPPTEAPTVVITGPRLSELPDAELRQLLFDEQVRFVRDDAYTTELDFIREYFASLEANPNRPVPAIGWTVLYDMYEDLHALVHKYYGWAE